MASDDWQQAFLVFVLGAGWEVRRSRLFNLWRRRLNKTASGMRMLGQPSLLTRRYGTFRACLPNLKASKPSNASSKMSLQNMERQEKRTPHKQRVWKGAAKLENVRKQDAQVRFDTAAAVSPRMPQPMLSLEQRQHFKRMSEVSFQPLCGCRSLLGAPANSLLALNSRHCGLRLAS